jgi:hypothetical protein
VELISDSCSCQPGTEIKLKWTIFICVIGWLLVQISMGVVQIQLQLLLIEFG